LKKELENTGNNAQKIKEESEKGLEQARKRIEQLQEQRRKEEEKRAAEEAVKKAAEDKAKGLVQYLCDLISEAEKQVEVMKEIAKPLDDNSCSKLIVAEVEAASRAVEEAMVESKRRTKECTDFILQRGPEMKDPTPTMPGEVPSEMKQVLASTLQRINDVTKGAEATLQGARGAKDMAVKRAAAVERTREMETVFAKYDKDADEVLSSREVQALVKGEYGFLLPSETLDAIWKNMVDEDSRGVKFESFPWLKTMVGVAREIVRDKDRLNERKEKEQVISGMKGDLKDRVKEAGTSVKDADKEVVKVEKQVQVVASKVKSTPPTKLFVLADEIEKLIEEAKESVAHARQELDSLTEGLESRFERDLKEFIMLEAKQQELHMGRLDLRITRTVTLCSRFREKASRKRTEELERLRKQAAKVFRYNQKLREMTLEAFF